MEKICNKWQINKNNKCLKNKQANKITPSEKNCNQTNSAFSKYLKKKLRKVPSFWHHGFLRSSVSRAVQICGPTQKSSKFFKSSMGHVVKFNTPKSTSYYIDVRWLPVAIYALEANIELYV